MSLILGELVKAVLECIFFLILDSLAVPSVLIFVDMLHLVVTFYDWNYSNRSNIPFSIIINPN